MKKELKRKQWPPKYKHEYVEVITKFINKQLKHRSDFMDYFIRRGCDFITMGQFDQITTPFIKQELEKILNNES